MLHVRDNVLVEKSYYVQPRFCPQIPEAVLLMPSLSLHTLEGRKLLCTLDLLQRQIVEEHRTASLNRLEMFC